MRHFFFLTFTILLLSCNDEEFSTGSQFFNGISFEYNSWDTLTLKMSTVRLDSMVTSSSSEFLIGNTVHPDYGKIHASAYFQITPDSSGYKLEKGDATYDSITLIIDYSNYYYNDTTQNLTLVVDELAEDLDVDDDTGYIYNHTDFATKSSKGDSSRIVKKTIKPRPFSGDPIEITLSDEMGMKFFEEAFLSDNDFTSTATFLDFFAGFKIWAQSGADVVIGFSPDIKVKLYYTDKSVIPSEQEYLSFANQQSQELWFNHYDTDYTGTIFENVFNDDTTSVASENTDNKIYLQGGLGLGMRIEMPYVKKVIEDNPELLLNEAILKLVPIKHQYQDDDELPKELQVYMVDKHNTAIGSLSTTMTLSLDDEFDENTYYTVNVKEFVDLQLSLSENNENALFISLPTEDFQSTIGYLSVGDQHNKDYKAQIQFNLIQLKND